jgi:DNA-binding NtrC family response regulator
VASSDHNSFSGIIGRSASMRALFERIVMIAPLDAPVLIRGETGTGKELVARAIWSRSARRDRRFEAINAGGLTRELLRSELFGHERGSFTGALTKKAGLLAVADGGTVFFDEIGDLPLEQQVTLLRFFQDREIRPVGSNDARRVNVRLIAATHRDLEAAVDREMFREDLYYRLRRAILTVPPLRERREDIPLLVEHIVAQVNGRYGFEVRGATAQALRRLEEHPWPGNVRELEAVIEEAMIFWRREWIAPEHLELHSSGAVADAERVDTEEPEAAAVPNQELSWLQREALRLVSRRRELRRGELMQRFGISREIAHRCLAALVGRGLLRRIGSGRGARYVPLSFWLTWIGDAFEWVLALV